MNSYSISKIKPLIFSLSLLFLFSCGTKQENRTADKAIAQEVLTPLQITVVADLHDSLQPKTIVLDDMPKPDKVDVPTKTGGSYSRTNSKGEVVKINVEPPVDKPLAVLRNQKGEAILDAEGNAFVMGAGGRSNFTTFTTDDGLALDAIACSIMDRNGNLWFGTGSGGVSRYDGNSFTNFTTAQGLASNGVNCIIEDRNGNLWFGTDGGGVSKYDGRSFINFTEAQGLASNAVNCITEDRNGNLWFGTWNAGVSKYDGNTFTNFTTDQGLANNRVRKIIEDKAGNLWFGTRGGGVSKYDRKRADQPCNLKSCKHDLLVPSDLEEHNKELVRSFTSFTTAQGLAGNEVLSIIEDRTGNLWFGTNGAGLSRYEAGRTHPCHNNTCKHDLVTSHDLEEHNQELAKSFTSFTTSQGLADNIITSITEDRAGNLWFGTYLGGVGKYDGNSFTSFSTGQGLANDYVTSITEDKAGSLWFTTASAGVSKYDGSPFTSFTTAHGLAANAVYSITEDKTGNLWFGTSGGGVSKYDGRSFTNFNSIQGRLSNNYVNSVFEDRMGNLWFATDGAGVIKYDGKSFTDFTTAQGLTNDIVFCINEDRAGNLWFGTYSGGVSRFDGKTFTNFTTSQGLADDVVNCIMEDKTGDLWFGTHGGGVSKYDGSSFTNFTNAHGLVNNAVYSITEDKSGNLWFGTDDGLSVLGGVLKEKLQAETGKAAESNGVSSTLFKSFRTADGLPDNFVTQVVQLPNGKMAIGTNLGFTLFDPSEDLTELINIEVYNTNTGFPIKDVNVGQNCMLLDSKGVIWAGTGSEKTALVRFEHAALRKSIEPPIVVIKSVQVEDEHICWYDLQTKGFQNSAQDSSTVLLQEFLAYGKTLSASEKDSIQKLFGAIQFDSITPFYPLPLNLVLPYRDNNISFDFIAIETGRNFMVRYQYILEGYSHEWSPLTDKTSVSFGNIFEGTYTFKLKARSPEGIWSEPVTYTFTVLPPWYRTWWAYSIYALLFLLAMAIFIKWRERNLRIEKEILEHTVEVRTAEVVAEKKEVEKQKQRSDELLLNILPSEVAEELKAKGFADAKQFDQITVLFTDFKGFTAMSEQLSPKELVKDLHECFSLFDKICEKYGIEKIKTIGDAYMAAGGLPMPNQTHPQDVVKAALEMAKVVELGKAKKLAQGQPFFEVRIGIHTGSVVAGIVGVKKFQYDIWGDTVNTASRMESSGEVGKVNISETTYKLVKDAFSCEFRGEVEAKGKGKMKMYFVEEKG